MVCILIKTMTIVRITVDYIFTILISFIVIEIESESKEYDLV